MTSKKFDFASSIALIITALYVIYESMDIYEQAKEPMYLSPALVPLILSIALLLCSILLFVNSIKDGGASARIQELSAWFAQVKSAAETKSMLIGTIIIGIYT